MHIYLPDLKVQVRFQESKKNPNYLLKEPIKKKATALIACLTLCCVQFLFRIKSDLPLETRFRTCLNSLLRKPHKGISQSLQGKYNTFLTDSETKQTRP